MTIDINNFRENLMKAVFYSVLLFFVILLLGPVVWLVITSVKPKSEIYSVKLPSKVTISSYLEILNQYRFDRFFYNSIVVAGVTTFAVTVISLLGAYGFSKYKYRFSDKIFFGGVLLRMVPFITLMLPLYIVISRLNLINSKTGLIIANTTFALPIALWILRTFLDRFPNEIIESASIDGASRLGILFRIVTPLSMPAISTVIILTFIGAWNEFLFALVATSNIDAQPLTVGLSMLTEQYGVRWDLMTAAGTLYIIPTLTLVILFQKYIVSGLTLGAIKG